MEIWVAVVLFLTGLLVGVINTFAGAGATVSLAIYSFLGMDLQAVNATNRISVIFQTATVSYEFGRQGKIDYRLGLSLGLPTIIGAIIGSHCVSYINEKLFAVILCVVLLLMFALLIYDPTRAIKGAAKRVAPKWHHYVTLLFIGFYGGAFHFGIGYLFLTLFVVGLGYDLLCASAMKAFVVLLYSIFALGVYALEGNVVWADGLVHGAGNMVGAYFAARYSNYMPTKILRYGLILFIAFMITYIIVNKIC